MHLVVLYYLITIFSGGIGISISIILYLKIRKKPLAGLIPFQLFLFLLVGANSLYFYIFKIMKYHFVELEIGFSIIFFICFAGMMYLVPYLIHSLISKFWGGWRKALFAGLSILPFGFLLCPLIISHSPAQTLSIYWYELYGLYIYLFFGMILYSICLIGKYLLTKREKFQQKILLTVFFLGAAGLPLFLIDGFWECFQIGWRVIPRFVTVTPLFYIFWNCFTAKYGTEILLKFEKKLEFEEPVIFLNKYKISAREMEVMEQAVQGKSYDEIAEMLHISVGTVRNHLHAIYLKTGVSSKVDLILLMQKEK